MPERYGREGTPCGGAVCSQARSLPGRPAEPDTRRGEANLRRHCEVEASVFGDWLIRYGDWGVEEEKN